MQACQTEEFHASKDDVCG